MREGRAYQRVTILNQSLEIGSWSRSSSVKGADGKSYEITPDLLKIEPITVTEHGGLLRRGLGR